MLDEIRKNINERLINQPDSRCASADEVRICWLISEIERLQKIIYREQKDSTDRCVCPNCGQPHDPRLIKCDQPKQDNC